MKQLTSWIVFASLLLMLGSVVLSIVRPDLRTWPRLRGASWRTLCMSIISHIGWLGVLALGIIDRNSFIFNHWARFLIGGPLMASGGFVALWAVRILGLHRTHGLEGELVRSGPYRYSRNPQYLGSVVGYVGYAVLCNSGLTLIGAVLFSSCLLLAPFAEEPWLSDLLGAPYEEYKAKVPRFL